MMSMDMSMRRTASSGNNLRKKSLDPYQLTLRSVRSVNVPDQLAAELERSRPGDEGAPTLFHRLSVSLVRVGTPLQRQRTSSKRSEAKTRLALA